MKYDQAIRYLESFKKFGIRLGLDRVESLLSLLGNPEKSFRSIHIAGTNGKGSVAAMMSSILAQAGYKVGLYTSPHLVDYTERIRINKKNISKQKFANAVQKVKNTIKRLPSLSLTEFEVLTAASFILFAQENIDIAVVEVGLGGRLDATNVITPILSIITNIDYDHMDVLGRSLKKIAKEKAGIIKPGIPLVTGEKRMLYVFKEICRELGSRLYTTNGLKINSSPLAGKHQIENTKVAIAGIKALNSMGFKVSGKDIDKGLKRTRWPGRMQIISKTPFILCDGAHNPSGAKVLSENMKGYKKKFSVIIGMQANKDISGFIKQLKCVANRFIVVRSTNPGAAPVHLIANEIKYLKGKAIIARRPFDALEMAKRYNDPICMTGSLYLLGDAFRQKLFD